MKHSPESILAATTGLIDEQGVGVSTAAIAKAAHVSNGTLFNYFPNKQEILDRLYVFLKTELAAQLAGADPQDTLENQFHHIWTRWFAWATQNPAKHRVILMLRESNLISPTAKEGGAAAFREHGITVSSHLADLPTGDSLNWRYLTDLFTAQLEYAVRTELSPAQAEDAFARAWASVCPRS